MSSQRQQSFSERFIVWFNTHFNQNQMFRRLVIYNIFMWIGLMAIIFVSFMLNPVIPIMVSFPLMFLFLIEVSFFIIVYGVEKI